MLRLPFKLPAAYPYAATPGSLVTYVDTGGYDVLLDGHGFRLATDQQFPYERYTEPTTSRRYDSSLEPGEQSLSPLPWIKSQSSFHGGAGQQNAEQGFTAFQYDQEQVEHIRFDQCIGVDPWTPGKVSRLPDCNYYSLGITPTCAVSATVGGVDYMVVGGTTGLYQVAWNAGADASPTVTALDLSAYGGSSNCLVSSVTTDGQTYYALVNFATRQTVGATLSYVAILSGRISSDVPPVARYAIPDPTARGARENLCPNPSFTSGALTNWTTLAGMSVDAAFGHSGSKSMHYSHAALNNTLLSGSEVGNTTQFPVTAGMPYTVSAYFYFTSLPTTGSVFLGFDLYDGSGVNIGFSVKELFPLSVPPLNTWVRYTWTYTPISTVKNMSVTLRAVDSVTTGTYDFHVDDILAEQAADTLAYFDGDTVATGYAYSWTGTAETSASFQVPTTAAPGALGWTKARLLGAVGNSVYDLENVLSQVNAALPAPSYTHPTQSWTWRSISESPRGVLIAGDNSGASPSSVLEMTLDTSTGTPVLLGGSTVAALPIGERVVSMQNLLGTFIALGTTKGIRIGTFDTYTGNFKYGPLTVESTQPVYALGGRDRFVYGGYTNQQANGSTGLVRVDLSMEVDTGGRLAWAPDLRPKSTDPQTGVVLAVDTLSSSGRIAWVTAGGIYVEGNGPGIDGDAWVLTSRIRYATAEQKLFKLGRFHGDISAGVAQISAIPSSTRVEQSLATFAFQSTATNDPDEYRLPSSLNEWIQLKFYLFDNATLESYQAAALPAPHRQHIVSLTMNCFSQEVDRYGLDVTDPEVPRQRYENLKDLEASGKEFRFVEFTNIGAVSELVVIDQIEYHSFSRPSIDDDFGGYITVKLRATES